MNDVILIVDDDRQLCGMLAEYLAGEGFEVSQAHDGAAGVAAVRERSPALVVMDITMPVLDGFDALRRIRGFSEVPVLMLTARGEELDRIVGLELGADDYLAKPFNPRELAARLRAILRRARGAPVHAGGLELDDLRLEPGAREVYRGGQRIAVTATEFALLERLMRAAGSVVEKEDLSREVLGRELSPFDRSLDTHVSNLRGKLGPLPTGEPRIKTVRGRGYQLVMKAVGP